MEINKLGNNCHINRVDKIKSSEKDSLRDDSAQPWTIKSCLEEGERLNGGPGEKCEIKTQTGLGDSGKKHRRVTWLDFCHSCKNQGHRGYETLGS